MKKGDYQTKVQAEKYFQTRFAGALSLVHKDEILILRRWLKEVGTTKTRVYLDLGAGTGRVIKELLEHHPETIYALDNSKAMLNYLKGLYPQEVKSGAIKLLEAPSNKIPLKEASVDVVTAFHLFKHLANIKPTLKATHRVLRKDGYLIFEVLNKNSIVRFNLGTCFAFSEAELKEQLAEAGFVVKDIVFLHNFGETPYKLAGPAAKLMHILDGIFTRIDAKTGTKIFVLAQKV